MKGKIEVDRQTIYVKMKHHHEVKPSADIYIRDVASLAGEETVCEKIKNLRLYKVTKKDKNVVIIDILQVINTIHAYDSNIEVQPIGLTHTVVRVKEKRKPYSFILFLFTWLLLFLGSGLAIMYFHEDVNMREVHQKIYWMITGNKIDHPWLLQIPYSLGLGIGMILFFNHLFKKKFNEEPSPLEIEMFNYEQSLDQYLIVHENKSERKK